MSPLWGGRPPRVRARDANATTSEWQAIAELGQAGWAGCWGAHDATMLGLLLPNHGDMCPSGLNNRALNRHAVDDE